MADGITIDVDVSGVCAALDQFLVELEHRTMAASEVTAQRVATEARARLQRQLGPGATGASVEGITVEKTPHGYAVVATRATDPMVPIYLERGTSRQKARPFLMDSARLEEGAHERRIGDAAQEAAAAVGLGE